MIARLTTIAKKDGGVRGIATGTTLRRVVGRTLAKQYMKDFEDECSPFQYALSTRAGTDCVGHMLRAATDWDPSATVLKVDGIGASRSRAPVCHVGPTEWDARCTSVAALCAVVLRKPVLMSVV